MSADELVDEMSIGSFPASDPPSTWAGISDRSGVRLQVSKGVRGRQTLRRLIRAVSRQVPRRADRTGSAHP
jgi:hypothetical protein